MSNKPDIKRIKLRGKCKWAKVLEPYVNEDYDISEYAIDLQVDDKAIKLLQDAGMKIGTGQFDTKIKTTDDGERYITFKQPTHSRAILKGGKLIKAPIELKPPVVVDAQRKPQKALIGNGSEVLLLINVLKSEKYNRASFRLAGVQVLHLVSYSGGGKDSLLDEFDYIEGSDDVDTGEVSDEDDFIK